MLGSDNPLIKELSEVVDIDQLKEQLKRKKQERSPISVYPQLKIEYQSESERSLIPSNEFLNN